MLIDPDKVTEIIRETAALDVMPRFKKLAEADIREKAPGDLVTVADIDAERRLTRVLRDLIPGSGVLAEEAASQEGLELEDYHTDDATWLIDPVDGTRNFSNGETPFGIVVAFVVQGKVELSWIHLPFEDRTFVAERGSGAWIQGGARLGTADDEALEAMTGLCNYRVFEDIPPEQVRRNAEVFAELRNFRCASYDFVQLASGAKHFSLYRRLWPWDHAAGTLLFEEAGGFFARVDDRPYRPLERVWGLLCAPSEVSWETIRRHLQTAG